MNNIIHSNQLKQLYIETIGAENEIFNINIANSSSKSRPRVWEGWISRL